MPLFGGAFAAPNKGTTVLFRFKSLSTVYIPTENRSNQTFSRPLNDFPVPFKVYLIFKDFSRKPSKFNYFSSLCEPGDCIISKTSINDKLLYFIQIYLKFLKTCINIDCLHLHVCCYGSANGLNYGATGFPN